MRNFNHHPGHPTRNGRAGTLWLAACSSVLAGAFPLGRTLAADPTGQKPASGGDRQATPQVALEETRMALAKWIETQQIISREELEWQQGREILVGRLELVKQEIALLEAKLGEATSALAKGEEKRAALAATDQELAGQQARLALAATGLEDRVKFLLGSLPGPLREKLAPLAGRMPEKPAETKVSAAERFQNVIGILNEIDKANSEISVAYEVRTLSNGKRSEVQALYVGLGQAYYVSASGEAGIGRPASDGWAWEQADALGDDVRRALEIFQGKHTPAFVPLPARIQ
ncbi:MAG: DUF3450 family protein [Planctomycetes bacterium]|nr:DUF3450 family protein [Planctomycetota bacterium]